MSNGHRRRKYERHAIHWKTAVVFDRAGGEHVVYHTETQDLSVGGAAVFSEHDLSGTDVTLFLARPDRGHGNVETIRMPAQVVSSAFLTDSGAFRLGLRFLHANYDAQRTFAAELKAATEPMVSVATPATPATPVSQAILATPAIPATPATPIAPPAPAIPAARAALDPNATMSGGRLAALRQAAQAKQSEPPRDDSQEAISARVDTALRKAFDYLKELVDQLNVVKPPFTKTYPLATGVPPLDQLVWDKGQVDFRSRPSSRHYEQVVLYFRLDGKKQIEVTRESPAHEKLARTLTDNRIEYTKRESRNARGMVDKTTFTFPCEVTARLAMLGNYQTGRIDLSTRHVGRFGTLDHKIEPEAINDDSLEELAGFILGESPTINRLLHRP